MLTPEQRLELTAEVAPVQPTGNDREAGHHLGDPSDINVWRCLACLHDFYFAPSTRPASCPNCGKGNWVRRACRIAGRAPTAATVRGRAVSPDGVPVWEMTLRSKRGGDGARADESLVFDHSDPARTTKKHRVQTWNPLLRMWETVHDEVCSYMAKHRKPRAPQR